MESANREDTNMNTTPGQQAAEQFEAAAREAGETLSNALAAAVTPADRTKAYLAYGDAQAAASARAYPVKLARPADPFDMIPNSDDADSEKF